MENINKTLSKINKMLEERDWSYYRLAKESGIPYSSLSSMFQKNTQPTLSTLEKICEGLHISLAEFFSDCTPYREKSYTFTEDELELITLYRDLNLPERKVLMSYIRGYCRKPL